VVDKQAVPAELTVSDRQLCKEIDGMDGAELWRACFLGGMAEFVIIEVWRLRLDRIDGDGFRSMAQ
jgi:hypothetical protein